MDTFNSVNNCKSCFQKDNKAYSIHLHVMHRKRTFFWGQKISKDLVGTLKSIVTTEMA